MVRSAPLHPLRWALLGILAGCATTTVSVHSARGVATQSADARWVWAARDPSARVYVATSDDDVYALMVGSESKVMRLVGGAVAWTRALGPVCVLGDETLETIDATQRGVIVACTSADLGHPGLRVFAFRRDGALRWQRAIGGGTVHPTIAASSNRVAVCFGD